MNVKFSKDWVFADKPDGLSSYSQDHSQVEGFCELLCAQGFEESPNCKLFPVHSLDKSVSGTILFATSPKGAEDLKKLFEENKVQQKYFFLTANRSGKSEYEEVESLTIFRRIKRSPFFELWSADTTTHQPDQIRLHAESLGIPILGDRVYGGAPFPRLCLHAAELVIPGFESWSCPIPRLFERLGLMRDLEISRALCAIDRRQRLFGFLSQKETTLRLIDGDEVPGLTMDLLGSRLWLSWFRSATPSPRDLDRWSFIAAFIDRDLVVQIRPDRGRTPNAGEKLEIALQVGLENEPLSKSWIAKEGSTQYEFRMDSGESSGLFLDQRQNRRDLCRSASEKRVLNLFAYTGGFTLEALRGGASKTTHVDLSGATVDWARRNCELNGFDPGSPSLEFFSADVFFFLDRAKNKGRLWDIVLCDPPIFSRNKGQTFRIENDLEKLLKACREVLAPQGKIFVSTHFTRWSTDEFRSKLKGLFPKATLSEGKKGMDLTPNPKSLKAFWIDFGRQAVGIQTAHKISHLQRRRSSADSS